MTVRTRPYYDRSKTPPRNFDAITPFEPNKKGVYIASKAIHGPRWRDMRAAGANIISTWIDESEVGATSDWPDLWDRCIEETSRAEAVVLYYEDGETLKGALVEAGAALANRTPVHVVAPTGLDMSFVKHRLVHVHDSLDAAFLAVMMARYKSSHTDARSYFEDVRAFTEIADYLPKYKGRYPNLFPEERCAARRAFLAEELAETVRAYEAMDIVEIADGLADIVYIVLGTLVEMSQSFDPWWDFNIGHSYNVGEAEKPPLSLADPEVYRKMGVGLKGLESAIALFDYATNPRQVYGDRLGVVGSLVVWQAISIAVESGIPFDAVWKEVHRSNMAKVNPFTWKFDKRADGKVIKPANWTAPDVKGVLAAAGWFKDEPAVPDAEAQPERRQIEAEGEIES